jgi:hypothetical protein
MQFISGAVTAAQELKAGQSGRIALKLESPIALAPTDQVVICWLESPGSRVVGKGVQVI